METAPTTAPEVVATFRQAAEASRYCPLRRGHIIELTPAVADDVLISADLHGNRDHFNAILETAALDEHPRRHLILQEVCHGGPTYPKSGGCMSHRLLEDVARLKARYPERVHFLLSNHELAELTDFPIIKARRMLNLMFRCGLDEVYGRESEYVRLAATEFIGSCPLAVTLPGGIFISHSAPAAVDMMGFDSTVFDRPWEEADLQENGPVFRLVWGRDYRPENAQAFARLIGARVMIHGHEPCKEGYRVPNDRQIIIDTCGAVATYVLLPVGEELTQRDIVERITRVAVAE